MFSEKKIKKTLFRFRSLCYKPSIQIMAEASDSEVIYGIILSLTWMEYYDPDEYDFNKTVCEDCAVRVNSTHEMMLHLRTWDHYYTAVHSKMMVRGKFVCLLAFNLNFVLILFDILIFI